MLDDVGNLTVRSRLRLIAISQQMQQQNFEIAVNSVFLTPLHVLDFLEQIYYVQR